MFSDLKIITIYI